MKALEVKGPVSYTHLKTEFSAEKNTQVFRMPAVQSDASRAEGEGQNYDYVQLLRQTIYKENVTQMAGSTGGEKYHVEDYRN